MAIKGKTYVCSICKQEVLVTKAGGGILVCCGKPMDELKDKTSEKK